MTTTSKAISNQLFDRSGGMCERCGWLLAWYGSTGWEVLAPFSRQHRLARGMGGTKTADRIENRALLCGTATSPEGCHHQVENVERAQAKTDGWVIDHGVARPELVPIRHHTLGPVLLTVDGGYGVAA